MKAKFFAFLFGTLFALGLGISKMTKPQKIIGFLDFFGAWDPSMMFVMVGAILVYTIFFRVTHKMKHPLFSEHFRIPTKKDIDAALLGGACLFGIGWGLGGFCPGPALVSIVTLSSPVWIFLISMVGGMFIHRYLVQNIRR